MPSPIKVTLTTLHCLPIFRNIPDSQLAMLIPICKALEYDQGEMIIQAGDNYSSEFFLILSGTIRVSLRQDSINDRDKEVILAYLQGGDFFGELSMIDTAPRSANVIADTDCCVVSIDGEDFRQLIRRHIEITFFMLKNLALRLRLSDEKIRGFALQDVSSRVLAELELLAKPDNGRLVIKERFSRQLIARCVGASREMVGRALRELEQRGLYTIENGQVVLNPTVFEANKKEKDLEN